jgi:hypothetical protein
MPRNSTRAIKTQNTATTLALNVDRAEPIRAKKHRPHIPAAKILRIEQRHLGGESDREIARAEHCSRNTIVKVVRAPELQAHLQQVRERIWGMADCAADVLFEAIAQNRDSRIAYELLRDVGVLPRASQIVHQPSEPTPATKDERDVRQIGVLAAVIAERRRVFNVELPPDMERALEDDEDHPDEAENRD